MLVNSCLTVFHKSFDPKLRVEKWIRFNYGNETTNTIWWHGGIGARVNKGYEDANDVDIRIPYNMNPNLEIKNFKQGDILVQGNLNFDIITQQDLNEYQIYNIVSITDNIYGKNAHIHLGGK